MEEKIECVHYNREGLKKKSVHCEGQLVQVQVRKSLTRAVRHSKKQITDDPQMPWRGWQ